MYSVFVKIGLDLTRGRLDLMTTELNLDLTMVGLELTRVRLDPWDFGCLLVQMLSVRVSALS